MPRISNDMAKQQKVTQMSHRHTEEKRAEAAADRLFAEVAAGTIDKDPGYSFEKPPLNIRAPARKGTGGKNVGKKSRRNNQL